MYITILYINMYFINLVGVNHLKIQCEQGVSPTCKDLDNYSVLPFLDHSAIIDFKYKLKLQKETMDIFNHNSRVETKAVFKKTQANQIFVKGKAQISIRDMDSFAMFAQQASSVVGFNKFIQNEMWLN